MAQQTAEGGGMSPQLKQILILAVVVIAVVAAVWSATSALRGPKEQIVGTLEGAPKSEMTKAPGDPAPDPSIPQGKPGR